MSGRDYVVIFHGIFRTNRHMRKLAAHISSQGYDVLNLNYPSTRYPLETLVDMAWQNVLSHMTENKRVHFVGYSMGGLLVRALLSKYRPVQLGRVVLLAAPNHGSEVADLLKNNWLYKKLYGPAGQQLITNQSSIASLFSGIYYECGVLAGSLSLDPICSYFIRGKDDGKVSIESTKISGMKAHAIVNTTHTWFPHNKDVQRQTVSFLKNGCFLEQCD